MAERRTTLVTAKESDDPTAAQALLYAQTSLRLFERVLTLEAASAVLAGITEDGAEASA